jgi:hypothetical protein
VEKNFFFQGQIKDEMKNSKANLNGKWRSPMHPKRKLGIKVSWRPYNIVSGELIQGQNWQLEMSMLIIMASGKDFFSPRPDKYEMTNWKDQKVAPLCFVPFMHLHLHLHILKPKKSQSMPPENIFNKKKKKGVVPLSSFDPL